MDESLSPFTVIWVEENDSLWGAFNCWAEDSDHAQEQCENTYPDAKVIWVNPGHDNYSMEEYEVPEE